MQLAPIPLNEDLRLAALLKLGLLDTEPEARFDHITIAATERLHVPISTISLLDKNREFYNTDKTVSLANKEYLGKELTYNLTEPRNHSYLANGIMRQSHRMLRLEVYQNGADSGKQSRE